jgi:hypothetical protein
VAPLAPPPVGNTDARTNPPPAAGSPSKPEESDGARVARQAKEAALAASSDALKAFKVLIKNPVGGLREAFDTMGPTAALGVGVVFGVVFVLCILLGSWIAGGGLPPFSFLLKQILFAVVPIAAAIGGCFAAQAAFRGQGGIQADVFVAGASLLPVGAASLLLAILASQSAMITATIAIFALTTTTLMTYSGLTSVLRVPDVAATIVVPLIFVVDGLAFRLLIGSPFTSGFGP